MEANWTDRVTAGDPTTLADYEIACMKAENLAYKLHDLKFKDLTGEAQDEIWNEVTCGTT